MTKFLLGTTVFAGLLMAGAAQAADMPLKAPVRGPDCCVYANFSGWYVGFHGGGGVASNYNAALLDDFFSDPTEEVVGVNGRRTFGLWGVHGGYNFQMGQAVVGIEGDYSWANAKATFSNTEPDSASVKLRSLASVRGRAGAVFGNLFVYGTAGWGWAGTKFSFHDDDNTPANLSFSRNVSGVVGGVGVEWYLTKLGPGSLLLRSEWLHYAFGGQQVTRDFGVDGAVTSKVPDSVDVVRAGLTWKFP
jgi:outer membrane immunogenic protein